MTLTSASGVLALLDEPDSSSTTQKLKISALYRLNHLVDEFWPEIAEYIPIIEMLYEDNSFSERKLAASVVSKVYYHLDALEESVAYALNAGDYFDIRNKSSYVNTLIAQCIEGYIRLQSQKEQGEDVKMDSNLLNVVERMFKRCFDDGEFKQALGIAIEAKRLDKIRESILKSHNVLDMLQYCFSLCLKQIDNRGFRMSVFREIVAIYKNLDHLNYLNICKCLLFLDEAESVAQILEDLIQNENTLLIAYQIAFDLWESQNHPFLVRVCSSFKSSAVDDIDKDDNDNKDDNDKDDDHHKDDNDNDMHHQSDSNINKTQTKDIKNTQKPVSNNLSKRLTLLKRILSGICTLSLNLQFLYSHNKTNMHLLNHILDKLDNRFALTHNALVISHSIAQCGTSQDIFLRKNLEWLSKASNWAKFIAASSFGVVHKGHVKESLKLLGSYLPKQGQQGSPYQEGGALFAMGLIHCYQGNDKINFMINSLKNATNNEIIQHGACLGLGLVSIASGRRDIYELLKETLFTDNAVAGEAAGLAMGLTLLGSNSDTAISEMIEYAHETKHEKIIRGLALGLAFLVYDREEEADSLIQMLLNDMDPILRYGGCFAVAMAYVATGNNDAIKKLLHIAVSDVSSDVRRAAVFCIGFVLCASPNQVPNIVKLLSESFNPHARYGAAFAVGISCAGTGMKSAIDLLEPLLKDKVDFVKQSAQMALAMVLLEQNETQCMKTKEIWEYYHKLIASKPTSDSASLIKMGAIISSGIISMGGNNCTLSMISGIGYKKMVSVVGVAVFLQHWYWFPFFHFLSLAISPTVAIGLNKDLKMPRFYRLKCNAMEKVFEYPNLTQEQSKGTKSEEKAVELSITAKAKARRERKMKDKDAGKEVEMRDEEECEEKKSEIEIEKEKKKKKKKSKMEDVEEKVETAVNQESVDGMVVHMSNEEKWAINIENMAKSKGNYTILSNPSRITPIQQHFVSEIPSQRYKAIKKKISGIVMLIDTNPSEEENLIETSQNKEKNASKDEPNVPKPFEYLRD